MAAVFKVVVSLRSSSSSRSRSGRIRSISSGRIRIKFKLFI